MNHRLEVDSIILEFGTKRVLHDVYLKCETGKVTGLLGRNGSGKSSLMNIIYGELDPNGKSVRLNGKALRKNGRKARDMKYLPQFRFVPGHLRVRRVLRHFALSFNDFSECFPTFEKHRRTRFAHLSGGEQRIVEIYVILCSKTKFCMLDEPFSQVMPVHVEALKELIEREKQEKGILITDHLYEDILEVSDNLYLIANGKTYLTHGEEDLEALGYINGL